MLNYLIIYGKYYIFQCRSNHKNPSLHIFLLLVKDRLSLDKYIYISKDKSMQFDERFGVKFNMMSCFYNLYVFTLYVDKI